MSAMKACFLIAECSLFYAKIAQMSAMKACFLIAECSLFYAKIVQMSAMKARFLIAECSLFYAKLINNGVVFLYFFAFLSFFIIFASDTIVSIINEDT